MRTCCSSNAATEEVDSRSVTKPNGQMFHETNEGTCGYEVCTV